MEKTNTIITIGRQFGSAGREIGYKVADKIWESSCTTKKCLQEQRRKVGSAKNCLRSHDEKPTNSFLYSLVMDTYSHGILPEALIVDMPINHKVFLAQFDAIKKIANEGPCILVGRCADYALEDNPNLLSVFIHADLDAQNPAELQESMI